MLNNKQIRKEFSWFKNNSKMIYLDSGATSLKPDSVVEEICKYYKIYTFNPHNKNNNLSIDLNHKIFEIRTKIAKFLNCNANEIAFTSGATESLNLFAFGLSHLIKPKDEIIVPEIEHSSNLLPWLIVAKRNHAKLITITENEQANWTKELLSKITKKTRIVSFASVSNILGISVNSYKLAKEIKKINPNTIVIVDATQEVQHKKINLNNSVVDLLCFSAHKVFGPTGIGVAYISKKMQNILQPFKYGGDMYIDYNPNDLSASYLPCPNKFEGGTQNIAGIFGFGAAIDFINRLGIDNIQNYEKQLSIYFYKKIKTVKNVILGNKKNIGSPIIVFNIKNCNPQDVAYYLSIKNIIVRSGVSCANMLKHRSQFSSGYVRVSLSIYNNTKDIDFLIKALKEFKIGDSLVGLI